MPKKQKIFFVSFLLLFLSVFLLSQFVPQLPFVLLAILIIAISVVLWWLAGKVIFDSLLKVSSTAGVAVSVIVFLSMSYCDLPENLHTADDSVFFIFSFGFLYAIYLFYKTFKREIIENLELLKDANKGKHDHTVLILFFTFIAIFIWQFYLVINPIIKSLCIF